MKESITIPRLGPQDLSTNYHALMRKGVEYCQQLSGDLWTDYNLHDPGVTILQQLCYAITDLSYRTDFDVKDLLAIPPGADSREHSLFTGDRILTCNPVTPIDYQELLFNRVRGLKNSWLVPIENHPLGIKGLYEVQVEMREELGPEAVFAIRKQVEQCMRSARNLAEDVDRVTILNPQPIRVEGVIEIGPQSNPVAVLAQVLFEIQSSLSPYPTILAVDEQFAGNQPDEIWNGPSLELGALDERCLEPLKTTVDAQEIVSTILKTRGVKRVKHVKISSPPDEPTGGSIKIKEGCVPRLYPPILRPREAYTIKVELEGGVKWHVDSKAVWAKIQELASNLRNDLAYAARSLRAMSYLQVPAGEYKNIENYFSIQHQFPVVYGLSKYGITDSLVNGLVLGSNSERQARMQQLKAYLLFFEQLLANYLSQLAHVGDLFSLDETLRQSYFHQPLAHHPPLPSEPHRIADVLVQQTTGTLRTLSHFLVCVVDLSGKIVFVSHRANRLTQAQELLNRIIESSQHSGNYRLRKNNGNEFHLALHDASGNLVALGQERFSTAEAALAAAEKWASFMTGLVRVKPLREKHVKIFRREDLSVQVIDEGSRIVLTSTGIQSQEERERRIAEIISCGKESHNYRFVAIPRGGFRAHLYNTRGELIAEGEESFETEFDAEDGVDRLVELIDRLAQNPSLRDSRIRRLPEVEEIGKNPLHAYLENLDLLERHRDSKYLGRRDKILNHLLARFGEQFDDDILQQLDLRPFGEKDDFYDELIRWKIEFLRSYIDASHENGDTASRGDASSGTQAGSKDRRGEEIGLGSGRGQAFDYGATDGSNAVSGLERRLALLLGMHGHIDGGKYRSPDDTPQRPEDSGFYYVEKQVTVAGHEDVHDEKGERYQVPRFRVLGEWLAGEPDLLDLHHNFVFSSEDSGLLRNLLAFGTNRENYRLHAVRDEYHVMFRSPNADHGIEVHHGVGKQEAERAISALIANLRKIKKSAAESYMGERMWVMEHVLLRPRAKIEHRPVRISHQSGIHLSSPPLRDEHRGERLELILRHGQHQENFKIETDSLGDFLAILHHDNKPIAHTHPMRSREEVEAAILLLAGHISSLCKIREEKSGKKKEKMLRQHVHDHAHDTFYSQRMSVLLPNWPLRFQGNEFKLYAEHMIQENAPAHLAVNVFWLSAYDTNIFEELYNHWKSENQKVFGGDSVPDQDQLQTLDRASEKLRDFIQRLQKQQERWAASTAGKP